jgi:hypothetical protein
MHGNSIFFFDFFSVIPFGFEMFNFAWILHVVCPPG